MKTTSQPPSDPLSHLPIRYSLRTTGKGSDYLGPCEWCGKNMSEGFALMTEEVAPDGRLLNRNAAKYGHEHCLRDSIPRKNGLFPMKHHITTLKHSRRSADNFPEGDVDVIERESLDTTTQAQFSKPWLVAHSDGTIFEFDTEGAACRYQRNHRRSVGLDEMTGEKALA